MSLQVRDKPASKCFGAELGFVSGCTEVGLVWYTEVWYLVVWYMGEARYVMVWYCLQVSMVGVVCCGVVLFAGIVKVWCGMLWYGMG